MTPREILVQARDILSDPAHWTRHVFARDSDGRQISEMSPKAASWCLLGAVMRTGRGDQRETDMACNAVYRSVVSRARGTSSYNDNPATTHADILSLLDEAIESLDDGTTTN